MGVGHDVCMPSVTRTFEVTVPPSVVIPYLADLSHAEEWDPGTVRCVREGTGPVEVGASWHNESKIAGISTELTYTLEELTDSRIVLVGRNETATSTETIDVVPAGFRHCHAYLSRMCIRYPAVFGTTRSPTSTPTTGAAQLSARSS